MMCRLLLFCCFLLCVCVSVLSEQFQIPDATLELLNPKGLKISIPATDEDLTLVTFHVNVNEEFFGVEHGEWAMDVTKKTDGRWTGIITDLRVKKGDTIYYWIYANRNGLRFQKLHQEYKVTYDPHGPDRPRHARSTHTTPTNSTPAHSTCPIVVKGQTVCADQVIFSSTFRSAADLKSWSNEVYIDAFSNEDAFMLYDKDRSNIQISNNHLVIQPMLLDNKHSEEFVSKGNLTLNGCTSDDADKCSATSNYWQILPPVMSARLTSRKTFNFQYGTVEIKAKLPRGDWIVPDLTLEPTESFGGSSRIIIGLARGNVELSAAGHDISNRLLQAGVQVNAFSDVLLSKPLPAGLWSTDFHVFKVDWAPDRLEFSVDNHPIGRLPSPIARQFTKECYVSLGVHVGGRRDLDFPDGSIGSHPKPWKNSEPKAPLRFWQKKSKWLPSWGDHSALIVQYVKVTALPAL